VNDERPVGEPVPNSGAISAAGILQGPGRTLRAMTDTTITTFTDRFLDAIVNATIADADVWTDDAHLDATVPEWRFTATGADAIRATYATWFADAGRFEELRSLPTPGGIVVEYLLTWEDAGVPHAAHHAHLLTLAEDGRIAEDHVFCGGRWSASRLAEMEAAAGG
jgi:hypothetical protein